MQEMCEKASDEFSYLQHLENSLFSIVEEEWGTMSFLPLKKLPLRSLGVG